MNKYATVSNTGPADNGEKKNRLLFSIGVAITKHERLV